MESPMSRLSLPLPLPLGSLLLALLSTRSPCAAPQPPLPAIDLPHSYYYRELYLPQLTSGPSSLAWAPDSRALVFSMAGSLWRQRTDSTLAEQLTDGPGYDHQPDWSPDGRYIVYVSTQGQAMELWLLEPASGRTRQLTHTGAVNVEPRWSPDGGRIVYVSTAYHRHFHVFAADFRDGELGEPALLTGENQSPLPRYYYSAYDHEINPTWTRDGKSIVFVSNRGRIHGTGGFWRAAAVAGAEPVELRYEETSWGARPDFSPDGARIVYSSYLGRNWMQLWLMPASGGEPFPLTYGEWDETGPRWSPDGAQIAFISNRGGDMQLRLLRFPAGNSRALEASNRRRLRPSGALHLTVRDEQGSLTAARAVVTDASGRFYAPAHAWTHHAEFDRNEQPFEARYFHTAGDDVIEVPAGTVSIELMKGLARAPERRTVEVRAGSTTEVDLALPARPWLDGSYWGHLGILGLRGGILLPGYAGYPNTAAASLSPTNADIADLAHARGALIGYVHPFEEDPQPLTRPAHTDADELPVDVALGKVDYMEIVAFADHKATAGVWYRLLNLGFRIPAAAGTDAMANYATLRGPVGLNRVYASVANGPLRSDAWLESLRSGRTFATNGPLLNFSVGGRAIGSTVPLARGQRVPFTAGLRSIVPLEHAQVVCNGRVARELALGAHRDALEVSGTLPIAQSGWCLLRAFTAGAEYPILDNFVYATTSPVYVSVRGERPRSLEDARYFEAWIDHLLETTASYPDWNSPAEKAGGLRALKEARAVYGRLE